MAKKIKLAEAAKDLQMSSKELAAFLEEQTGSKKNSSSAITEEELNLALEYFSQQSQTESFDEYFASRSQPRSFGQDYQKSGKKQDKSNKGKKSDKSEKQDRKSEPQKPETVPAEPEVLETSEQEQKAPEKLSAKKRKEEKKKAKQPQVHGEKTRLSGVMSTERMETTEKRHTVDTRGSYVDLDKYNERYEQIAPADRHKDSFSPKKQKITQKSAQRNKKGGRKQETEAQRLSRLELERARKQQLKVKIPDSIQVSELAARLKVTASKVIGKLMGLGVMASINEEIDFDTASLVAEELGAKVEHEVVVTIEERLIESEEHDEENQQPRPPVVVVMGHVD
ncbi:MAG TPA: translation initiation factor IF-2, partial [Ruminococcus sp.]|nr:translation initiation factor IF-2 [Ruminococcus sp.]